MDTIYDRFGGIPGVSKAVVLFYDKIRADRSLAPYFANVDMPKLMDHQTKFLVSILGGPKQYTGADLKTAHARLSITDDAFNAVAGHLKATLEECGASDADIGTILGVVGGARGDIVTA